VTALATLRRVMDSLLPWPSRSQRRAAVDRARGEKEQSLRSAAHAAAVRDDITSLAERNHFAAAIAEQITRRHAQGNGGAS
jgi:hypothetical protein